MGHDMPEWFKPFESGEGVMELLKEVNSELEALENNRTPISVVLVGGALLLILELRDATYDVDLFLYTTERKIDITQCIRRVAEKRSLPVNWANFDVENLPINVDAFHTEPLAYMSVLQVHAAKAISLMALKVLASLNRVKKDSDDIAELRKVNPEITFEEVLSHMREVCPTEYLDEDLARDMFDPITW